MENITLGQQVNEKIGLDVNFAETLKKQGFLKVHLPLLCLNEIDHEIGYYKRSLKDCLKNSGDWHYDASEKKQFAEKAIKSRKKIYELVNKYKYNPQKHEEARKQTQPFLEFLKRLDRDLISRVVSNKDINGNKTTDFEKIIEVQADNSIRYCYFDRREPIFSEDQVSFSNYHFFIFSEELNERMKLENIGQDFEKILLQAAEDLVKHEINYDFGYVWNRTSEIISHPQLVSEGKMKDETSTRSASYGALLQSLYLRSKDKKKQWPFHPRISFLIQGINVTDGGGLLMVYDRKENDKYIFRPLNKEEYKRYIKYYIYRDNDYLNIQAF